MRKHITGILSGVSILDRLAYQEIHSSIEEAITREKQIKGG